MLLHKRKPHSSDDFPKIVNAFLDNKNYKIFSQIKNLLKSNFNVFARKDGKLRIILFWNPTQFGY